MYTVFLRFLFSTFPLINVILLFFSLLPFCRYSLRPGFPNALWMVIQLTVPTSLLFEGGVELSFPVEAVMYLQ
jgi:hypothetical protein